MANHLLMPKATAVWLVDNTALTFEQIADFCTLHALEVKAIADGDSAQGIKGLDPISTGQLAREEIEAGEKDPKHRLKMSDPKVRIPEKKRKVPRYTPLSKRQDRPNAIYWLVKNHPELKDAQVSRLVGTTKSTIEQIRNRTHWNMSNLLPTDPVALGLCSQIDLDMEVQKAAKNLPAPEPVGDTLLPASETEKLADIMTTSAPAEPKEEEIDAAAVFAKLSSMKSKPDEDEETN